MFLYSFSQQSSVTEFSKTPKEVKTKAKTYNGSSHLFSGQNQNENVLSLSKILEISRKFKTIQDSFFLFFCIVNLKKYFNIFVNKHICFLRESNICTLNMELETSLISWHKDWTWGESADIGTCVR